MALPDCSGGPGAAAELRVQFERDVGGAEDFVDHALQQLWQPLAAVVVALACSPALGAGGRSARPGGMAGRTEEVLAALREFRPSVKTTQGSINHDLFPRDELAVPQD